MATKELVKKEAAKKETALSPFVIFQTEIAEIREAMNVNVGDGGLTAGDLHGPRERLYRCREPGHDG